MLYLLCRKCSNFSAGFGKDRLVLRDFRVSSFNNTNDPVLFSEAALFQAGRVVSLLAGFGGSSCPQALSKLAFPLSLEFFL